METKRKIKFRAWNGHIMVTAEYGDWLSFDGVHYTEAEKHYNTPNIEVQKFKGKSIVMQFTGLHDKNGKEIYEGDIVRFDVSATERDPTPYVNQVGEVKISSLTTDFGKWQGVYCSYYRVIGNIYENPELLKP